MTFKIIMVLKTMISLVECKSCIVVHRYQSVRTCYPLYPVDKHRRCLQKVVTHLTNLTFTGLCIANIFTEYNQQDATFLKFIYFCKTLYMFQMVFPSITRSTKLHIQHQTFVKPLLLPAASNR